jgi:predicted nucleic acid-binding protein
VRFVLDASVAVSWCFDDEHHAVADAAFELLKSGESAGVPALFWFELRNAVLMGHRRKRISEQLMMETLETIGEASLIIQALPHERSIFPLALRHGLSFYDATYLELALRERLPLATLDKSLGRAAVAAGVPLIGA